MAMQFQKASKAQAKARIALIGPSGSGKTLSLLRIMRGIVGPLGKIAVIDSERGSASKYAGLVIDDQPPIEFDVLNLDTFSPVTYCQAIAAADAAGYDATIIDSLSHAWMGKDGALEQVDKAAKRSQSGNNFAAWRDVTPMHNQLVDAMLHSRAHLGVTMRSKTEYVIEKDERTGKSVPRKIGTAPIQRDGLEYEFDVVADMDLANNLLVSKTRCPALRGAVVSMPSEELGQRIGAWLSDGIIEAPPPKPEPKTATGGRAAMETRIASYVAKLAERGDGDNAAAIIAEIAPDGVIDAASDAEILQIGKALRSLLDGKAAA